MKFGMVSAVFELGLCKWR